MWPKTSARYNNDFALFEDFNREFIAIHLRNQFAEDVICTLRWLEFEKSFQLREIRTEQCSTLSVAI